MAKRILIIVLLFMIIPLFAQSFLLYKHEYHHIEDYYFHFATLVLFVGVIGGGAVYLFTKRVERPLRSLVQTMRHLAEGKTGSRYQSDRLGFEINVIGKQLNATLDAMAKHEKEAEKEKQKRMRLSEEFRIGHEIQESLVTARPQKISGVGFETSFLAAQEVSGDFYDLIQLEDGRVLVAIADIAGKGIGACLFALGLRSTLRSLAMEVEDLATLVCKVNEIYLMDAEDSSTFATLWLGIYHPKDKKLTYCSQGHPPALLKKKSEMVELTTNGIALGTKHFKDVKVKEETLSKGDLLLLYTDGVVEAHNVRGERFGKAKLQECMHLAKEKVAESISEAVRGFSHGVVQHDDVTVVALWIK